MSVICSDTSGNSLVSRNLRLSWKFSRASTGKEHMMTSACISSTDLLQYLRCNSIIGIERTAWADIEEVSYKLVTAHPAELVHMLPHVFALALVCDADIVGQEVIGLAPAAKVAHDGLAEQIRACHTAWFCIFHSGNRLFRSSGL
eukprot:jgi/Ulvmu1/1065/UM105_0024.1